MSRGVAETVTEELGGDFLQLAKGGPGSIDFWRLYEMKPEHGKIYAVCAWSCHGGRNRTNTDNKIGGRMSTMAAANRPSLPSMGG